jgi:hypothetical protein
MCECGCGEQLSPQFTFKGPAGVLYAVALAEGCKDCDGPAGVMLLRIPVKELKRDGIFERHGEALPDLPWFDRGSWSEVYFPIVGQSSLREALKEALGEDDEDTDGAIEYAIDEGSANYVKAAAIEIAKWRAAWLRGPAGDRP